MCACLGAHMFMCTATNWSRAWTVACTEVSVSRWRNAERWWEVDHNVPSEWRARCWCKHWLRYVASLTLNYDCKTCQRSGIWRMHNHMLGQTCYVYRHEATTPLCTEMQWSKCVCVCSWCTLQIFPRDNLGGGGNFGSLQNYLSGKQD